VLGIQEAAKKHAVAVNVGIHVPVPASAPPPTCQPSSQESEPSAPTKLLNRSLWVNADGSINTPATYDKLHLFDYGTLRESTTVQAGSQLTPPFQTAVGRVGSLICFDLRFPEPALALGQPGPKSPFWSSPAQILTFPSAFTIRTGQAHWEILLRARAVETQTWVVAAAQVGRHNERRNSYGQSMVVDPWGRVVLELGGVDSEGNALEGAEGAIGFVDVDLDKWSKVREQMPLARRT
jgi:deaminated glutathione amidase